MLFAIDFDGTYNLDPGLWNCFCYEATQRGHRVIVATSRDSTDGLPSIPNVSAMFACGPTHKRAFLESVGFLPDVWIDDQPDTVDGPGWLPVQRLIGAIKSLFRRGKP